MHAIFRSRRWSAPVTRRHIGTMFLIGFLALAGCATPVGVRHLDPKQVQRNLTRSVLSSDHVSAPTAYILNRAGLTEKFKTQPEEVLALLHKGIPTASRQDELFALAELSYLYASGGGPKSYFLGSAIYAYAFLFPAQAAAVPDPFDPRVRIATDLYNRAIAEASTSVDSGRVILEQGTYPLPFGEIAIAIDGNEFNWGGFRLTGFVQAAKLEVRGLRNRYRWPGIGAPLTAAVEPREGQYPRIRPHSPGYQGTRHSPAAGGQRRGGSQDRKAHG